MSEKILLLCPTHRDLRELKRIPECIGASFLEHEYASLELEDLVAPQPRQGIVIGDPLLEIDRILARCSGLTISAVISTDDYPGTTLASILSERLRLPGVSPKANILCQHKYFSRVLQREAVPEAVPRFQLLENGAETPLDLPFPLFVKPAKSFFSVAARVVRSRADLRAHLEQRSPPPEFFQPFDRLAREYGGVDLSSGFFLAEEIVEGWQATLEGYRLAGETHLLGVVDSIFYPGTTAFKSFEYPSRLPRSVQERAFDTAGAVLAHSGYDNGMFNVEFTYAPASGAIRIIEINPRMSSQFADLYEKVDGFNSYSVLVRLARGEQPEVKRGMGNYAVASSFALRRFQDGVARLLPLPDEVRTLEEKFPDARVEIFAIPAQPLSAQMQDGMSYRYGVVSLGGSDRLDLRKKYERCLSLLPFEFDPLESPTSGAASRTREGVGASAWTSCGHPV